MSENNEELVVFLDQHFEDDVGQEPIVRTTEEGHTLPLNVIEEQETKQFKQVIHSAYRESAGLARDVAYLGEVDADYILDMHGLTREQLEAKLKNPAFLNMVEKFRSEIGVDSSGMMRVRASAYLESELTRLHQIIVNPETKDENVIKGMELMSRIGGAIVKPTDDGTGTNIVFNFGSDNPMMGAKTVIEGTSNE